MIGKEREGREEVEREMWEVKEVQRQGEEREDEREEKGGEREERGVVALLQEGREEGERGTASRREK